MALSINPATKVIFLPKADLTFLSGSTYQLDVNQFKLDVMALLSAQSLSWMPDAFNHNTEVVLSGVTYARVIEFINGYTIEFEDGNYTVSCIGANHNIGDVKVVNSVSLIVNNSAGLITVSAGSGVTAQDKIDIAALSATNVWDKLLTSISTSGSIGVHVKKLLTVVKFLGLK